MERCAVVILIVQIVANLMNLKIVENNNAVIIKISVIVLIFKEENIIVNGNHIGESLPRHNY